METTTKTRTDTVLALDRATAAYPWVYFFRDQPTPEGTFRETVCIRQETFVELGRPETVTVRPR